MPESSGAESANVLTLDFGSNKDLAALFATKEVGDKCELTFKLQLVSRYPEGVTLAVEKVISEDGYGTDDKEPVEAKGDDEHPIMARMRSKNAKNRGMMGPHGRPPQTAENSAEPWVKSYV